MHILDFGDHWVFIVQLQDKYWLVRLWQLRVDLGEQGVLLYVNQLVLLPEG